MNKGKKGMLGELETARYLRDRGFVILSSDYTCRLGEIDIIAADKKYICFVEVKARSHTDVMLPSDAVGFTKRKKIIAAAKLYLLSHPCKLQPRFDVAEVYLEGDKVQKIRMIENAFDENGR